MDPTGSTLPFAILIGPYKPANLGCDTTTFREGSTEIVSNTGTAADPIQERRL